jgi:hypothetical protein
VIDFILLIIMTVASLVAFTGICLIVDAIFGPVVGYLAFVALVATAYTFLTE